jgi:hypothetical protein
VDHVVVGALELAAQRPLEGLDLGAEVGVVGGHPEEPAVALALDVGLVAVAHHQEIHGVMVIERTHHVAELHPGAGRARHGAEAGDEDARHGCHHAPAPRAAHQEPAARGRTTDRWLEFEIPLGYIGSTMNRLVAYLREQVFVDFQGELSMEKVRELLAGDESRDTKVLLARLTRDGGTNDMMVALADCLLEVVQRALSDEVMKEQLRAYIEA